MIQNIGRCISLPPALVAWNCWSNGQGLSSQRMFWLGGVPVCPSGFLPCPILTKLQCKAVLRRGETCAYSSYIHIVRVMDYGVDENAPFYVMEYLQGKGQQRYYLPPTYPRARFLSFGASNRRAGSTHQGILVESEICRLSIRMILSRNDILVIQDSTLRRLVHTRLWDR